MEFIKSIKDELQNIILRDEQMVQEASSKKPKISLEDIRKQASQLKNSSPLAGARYCRMLGRVKATCALAFGIKKQNRYCCK